MSRSIDSLAVARGAAVVALASLASLHELSPELSPSWRMVSEYANGRHGWVLTLFFAAWAVASGALAARLWREPLSRVGRFGTILVALSGVGEALGALFDVNHPLHGAAFGLGVPSLAVGAAVVGVSLARRDRSPWLGWVSQAPWLSVCLMGGSFWLCFSTAAAAGIHLTPGAPWGEVPAGVVAVMGWANRLLVLAYVGWILAVAKHLSRRVAPRSALPLSAARTLLEL